ncbi:hypothetical protein B9Z19DRAFT_1118137 [Tuber borchii]|uniref:Uncharacterized protein n=1 Tax=Tuber borchii TaxID=42251 RepID=A0A2T7A957_TUBBO|nr:hypothetical protein B9Z19DRAFT_1118137 [Tuber borchii]
MKSFLITLFFALATAIHAGATGNLKIRAHLDDEAERAVGMANAVTPEYKKAHGVTPELEAMILADGSGGQGTNNYYESFAPITLIDEGTKKQVETNSHDGLVISINPQPRGHTVVTAISSFVAMGGTAVTTSFTVNTTATSKTIICTSRPPWIPSPIRPTGTESVGPPNPSRSPITTITVTLTTRTTTRTSHPIGTVTISHILSSYPVRTTTIHPTPSFVTATIVTSGTPDGPIRTSVLIPTPTEHPSDASAEATTLDPIPKPSSNVPLTGLCPTMIPPTTLVTRARDPTTTIG